jgi:dTDP-4-dehydrorhamnose 3,5-epimerase-like enzyme
MKNFYTIDIKSYDDNRGCLTPFEFKHNCPFEIKRAFIISNVPNEEISRGKHINTKSKYLIIAIQGQVTITCEKDEQKESFILNNNLKALFIDNGVYRELFNFSENTILLCLSDSYYDKEEFI